MMNSRVDRDIIVYIATLVVFMITAAVNHSAIAQTEAVQKLTSELSGENEVPPTESQSTGLAEFNIIGTDSIEYNLNASNIKNVTAAHLHGGLEGVNGPILVTLFDHQTPMDQVSENGTITEHNPAFQSGTVTSEQQLHDFMRAMRNGQIYVNIHTEQHPDGEIRGQSQITTNDGS
jgi:hypothetical protein